MSSTTVAALAKAEEDLAHKINSIPVIITSVTMVTALLGNVLLAVGIVKTPSRSSRHLGPVQILILHTCAADIAFALFTLLPQTIIMITYPQYHGNDAVCKIISYLQVTALYASPFLLVAISADRFIAVRLPLRALQWKFKSVRILATAAWVASLLLGVPQLFVRQLVQLPQPNNTTLPVCMANMSPSSEKLYSVSFVIIAWLIPTAAAGVLYGLVCYTLFHSSVNNTQLPKGSTRVKLELTLLPQKEDKSLIPKEKPVFRKIKTGGKQKINQTVKTVKLTLTIVTFNFVLWSPFCITTLLYSVFKVDFDPFMLTYIMLVGNLNSCVNPWIYLAFNCKQITDAFCSSCCRTEQYNSHMTATVSELVKRRRSSNLRCVSRTNSQSSTDDSCRRNSPYTLHRVQKHLQIPGSETVDRQAEDTQY